jgi:hypothetical protein
VAHDTYGVDFWHELRSLVYELRERNAWDVAAQLVAAVPQGDMNQAGIVSLRAPLMALQIEPLAAGDPLPARLAKLRAYYGWLEALVPVYARGARVRVRDGAACGFGGRTGTIEVDVPTLGMRKGLPYAEWSVWFDDPPASLDAEPARVLSASIDALDLAPVDPLPR